MVVQRGRHESDGDGAKKRSSLSTLFEVRARRPLVYALLFLSAALLTWLLKG